MLLLSDDAPRKKKNSFIKKKKINRVLASFWLELNMQKY
jgi:hypothetical protein